MELRSAGFAPEVPSDREVIAYPADSLDAALIDGMLERTEWDRWLLQQIHRCLREEGLLTLEVSNLWSLASPGDVARLAARSFREVGRRLSRAVGTGTPSAVEEFRGRLYTPQRLQDLLSGLGFEIESCTPGGSGLLAPLAFVPAVKRFGSAWKVVARKRSRGIAGGSVPLSACTDYRMEFERRNPKFFSARDAWLARAGRSAKEPGPPLDTTAFGKAEVLVLAPHPDDELIGCGGTLLRLLRAGARVTCVQATDGSDAWALRHSPESVRRTVRLEEAERVAAAAGFAPLELWRADNRAFHSSGELVERLAALLQRLRPRLIFSTFLADVHPDHLTLNRILAQAIRRVPDAVQDAQVLGYEVWSKAPADWVCDVTEVRQQQESLLWMYPTAMKTDDFIRLCEERNYYNACVHLGRQGYAEVFQTSRAAEFPDLLEKTVAS